MIVVVGMPFRGAPFGDLPWFVLHVDLADGEDKLVYTVADLRRETEEGRFKLVALPSVFWTWSTCVRAEPRH